MYPEYDCPTDPSKIPAALSTFVFSFAILGTVPSVRSQMQQPKDLPSALGKSFVITAIAYLFVMSIGYYGFGETVSANVSKDLPGVWGITCSVAILINILLSAPIFMICVFSTIETLGECG